MRCEYNIKDLMRKMQVLSQTRAKLQTTKEGNSLFDMYALREEDSELVGILLHEVLFSLASMNADNSKAFMDGDNIVFELNDGVMSSSKQSVLCGRVHDILIFGGLIGYFNLHSMFDDANVMSVSYEKAKADYKDLLFESQLLGCN